MRLTTDQFELISWHDCTIHSIALIDEKFKNDLVLDIDYIEEWINEDGAYRFRVAPAHLVFHEVTSLSMHLTQFGMPTMYAYLTTINGIARKPTDDGRSLWTIDLLGDGNSITFESSGFTQDTYSPAIMTPVQHLTSEQRGSD